ncbi:MAG: nucleoside-diphosphate kinase [Treponema sp.]|jgi:nucleoside diphosphate kinase|nr:nucleoside-diphosphate kinase [Treponema sp.]
MNKLSYVLVTPYTIAKSRTGGVIARLLSRTDLELVGAQMIAPDEDFVNQYAASLRGSKQKNLNSGAKLLADYVEKNMGPSGGRRHRSLLLLFRGEDPVSKLSDICGALFPENRSVESMTGETIRDTYADLILDQEDPGRIMYFEPAVLTPRSQSLADENLALFARRLRACRNMVDNMIYPEPSRIEKTLVMIKPDNWSFASSRPGTIIDMFSRTGLRIIGIKIFRFSLNEALDFYGPVEQQLLEKLAPVFGRKARNLLEREFNIPLPAEAEKGLTDSFGVEYAREQFRQIINFMSGKRPDTCPENERNKPGDVKCMILVYEGEDAVKKIRAVLGPTDPLKAPGGTVRREFGSNVMVNTAHASDSAASYEREKAIVRIDENNVREIIEEYLYGKTGKTA